MNYTFKVNLTSKNSLKQLLLVHNILETKTSIAALSSTQIHHKNTLLNSPFHFKIVKTHLSAPTITYSITGICLPNEVAPLGVLMSKTYQITFKVRV